MSQSEISIFCIFLGFACAVTHSQAHCSISDSDRSVERNLLEILYQFVSNASNQPDPRVFIAMRLARYHQATKENQLFQRLVRTLLQTAHNGNGLSLSDLAFYALAVKAACGNPNNVSSEGHSINLIHQLNHDLQEKMKRFNTVSFDNTETYEYILNTFDEETSKLLLNISLAFLALCLEERVIPSDSVEWFVNEILYYQYPYRKYISFETNSYSILALTCLYHSITLYSQLRTKLFVAMQFSVEGLLRRLRSDGSFGGIVNTTLAIQAMGADILVHPLRYSCRKSLQYLINQTHTWNRTAMSSEALALIIEVLEGKTYLDISGIICDTNGQTSANTVPSSTLSSAPPAGTSLSTHHNMGTARASVDPPYRSTGGTRPFFGTVHRNTGLTHPTMEIRPPDTDTTRRVLSATGHRWGTIHPPLTLNVGHQTVAEPLSIRLHTATITTAQPRVSPGADTCCIPEEQRPLENLLVSILLETVGSCKDGPDPRVLIALRLSNRHNQSKEQTLQDCLLKSYSEKTVGDGNFTTGDIGLYTLAFRASCINPANIPNDNLGINLIRLLDTTLAIEMHALAKTKSYFTNSYQVSLAVLALCLENEEIAINIAHDFVSFIINFEAPEAKNMTTGAKCSYILALSCLLNSQGHLKSIHSRIQVAIQLLLSDLLQGLRANGSFGSVLDTGLVLQVLNAKLGPRIPLARDIYNCSQSLQTMLQTIINQMPPDTLDVVATLPALEGRSYLDIKQLCGSGESHCSEPGPLSLKILNGTQG